MGKFNYYADDINMVYQATPQESGKALYKILESLGSYGYTYNEVNNRINKQLNELGISSKDDLFKVLDEIADLWIKASTTGYKEEGWLLGPGTDEETDKSNEKSDLEIFGEKLESEIFSESNQPHTTTISFGPPMTIKADNTNNEFIIF